MLDLVIVTKLKEKKILSLRTPGFHAFKNDGFLKHHGKKGKYFSHNAFFPIKHRNNHLSNIKIVVFQFYRGPKIVVW